MHAKRATETVTSHFIDLRLTTKEAMELRDRIGALTYAEKIGPMLAVWNAITSALATPPHAPDVTNDAGWFA